MEAAGVTPQQEVIGDHPGMFNLSVAELFGDGNINNGMPFNGNGNNNNNNNNNSSPFAKNEKKCTANKVTIANNPSMFDPNAFNPNIFDHLNGQPPLTHPQPPPQVHQASLQVHQAPLQGQGQAPFKGQSPAAASPVAMTWMISMTSIKSLKS
jgi:hypothetical protein